MFIGPAEKSAVTDAAGAYLEKCFAAGGLEPKYFDDVRPYVWRKATSNSGFNTVCAVLRLKIREVYDDPYGVALVWQIWHEAADVAEAMSLTNPGSKMSKSDRDPGGCVYLMRGGTSIFFGL